MEWIQMRRGSPQMHFFLVNIALCCLDLWKQANSSMILLIRKTIMSWLCYPDLPLHFQEWLAIHLRLLICFPPLLILWSWLTLKQATGSSESELSSQTDEGSSRSRSTIFRISLPPWTLNSRCWSLNLDMYFLPGPPFGWSAWCACPERRPW